MTMSVPTDRTYLQTHEWHKLEADLVIIGITKFAADELTDITYVGLPSVGQKVSANGRWGEIESVKATADLYSGVDGQVVAVNDKLQSNPGLVNSDPYGEGWMIKVRPTNPDQVRQLLSAEQYLKKIGH